MDQKFPECVKLETRQIHIDEGKPGNCRACPIALAFIDHLNELGFKLDFVDALESSVRVFRHTASEKILARYLPETCTERIRVSEFIHRFDAKGCFNPDPITINYRLDPT